MNLFHRCCKNTVGFILIVERIAWQRVTIKPSSDKVTGYWCQVHLHAGSQPILNRDMLIANVIVF